MALEINGYSAQFAKFVEFAEQQQTAGKLKAVARLDVGGLEVRDIKAAKGDWVGIGQGRLPSLKEANNEARARFKAAIEQMFKGVGGIPNNVKDAMKMADFGKGKPLTARRILAVKAAVDQAEKMTKDSIATGKKELAYLFSEKEEKVVAESLIEAAFTACNGNTDAMDILNRSALSAGVNSVEKGNPVLKNLIMTGGGTLRSKAYVEQKVGDLVANLNELKDISKTNPRIYDLGKQMLQTMGAAIPQGTFTNILQRVNKASLAPFQKLSPSSSGMTLHNAVKQLGKFINDTMEASGLYKKLEGAEGMDSMKAFIADALLSRCGRGALNKMYAAMSSQKAITLNSYYWQFIEGATEDPNFDEDPVDIKKAAIDAGCICYYTLASLSSAISRNMAILDPSGKFTPAIQFEDIPNINAIGGSDLVDDIRTMGKELLAKTTRSMADGLVKGSGMGAEMMKKFITDKVDGLHDPLEKLNTRMAANGKAMMNWTICSEMKKLATGDGAQLQSSQFKKDLGRGFTINLQHGKTTIKLSSDLETARNELARFVTNDPNATYNTLVKRGDKGKVHLLMALISQETEKVGEDGISISLHKREAERTFNISGYDTEVKEKQAQRTYTIKKGDDGAISLNYLMDKPITFINDVTKNGEGYDLGEGSNFKVLMHYALKGEEVERLANLDYSTFEDKECDQIFNREVDMSDGTRQFKERKLEEGVNTFGKGFKIDASCVVNFTMTLNPSDEELIQEQRNESQIVA